MADAIATITDERVVVVIAGSELLLPLVAAAEAAVAELTPITSLFGFNAPPGFAWAITDGDGKSPGGVKNNGTWQFGAVEIATINGQPASQIGAFRGAGNFPADIVHFPSYGQSLSCGISTGGAGVGAVVSSAPRFDNLKFVGGVRAWDSSSSPYASFQPLTETVSSANQAGETPCAGAAEMVKEMIASEDGVSDTQQSFQILCSAPGFGGETIAQLGNVGAAIRFNFFMNEVTQGLALAAAAGKTFKLLAFQWLQGEADVGNTHYDTDLMTLRSDVTTHVQAITGQTEPVYCIAYEGDYQDTVVMFRKAMLEDPHIIIAGAIYQLPRADGLHFTALSSKHWGAYAGRAFKRTVIDKNPWVPLHPIATFRQGNIAEVKFNVPHGPLVWDTSAMAPQTNQGFRLFRADGTTAITISTVAITQPDTVRIVAGSAIPAGAILRYGFSDPTINGRTFGGNLRDSDPAIFDGGGLGLPMQNWCICFQETLA